MAGFGLAEQMGQAAPVVGTRGGDLGGREMTPNLMDDGAREESMFLILQTVSANGLQPRVIEALVMDQGQEIVEETIGRLQAGDPEIEEMMMAIEGGSPHEMPTTPAGGAMEYPMNPGMY